MNINNYVLKEPTGQVGRNIMDLQEDTCKKSDAKHYYKELYNSSYPQEGRSTSQCIRDDGSKTCNQRGGPVKIWLPVV